MGRTGLLAGGAGDRANATIQCRSRLLSRLSRDCSSYYRIMDYKIFLLLRRYPVHDKKLGGYAIS
jgi:hypothetical protein